MSQPPITRGSWILAAIFGLLMIIGCGVIFSYGVKMQNAVDEANRPTPEVGEAQRVKAALATKLWHERPWSQRGEWSDYRYGQVVYSVHAAPDGSLLLVRADPSGAAADIRPGAAFRAVGAVLYAFGQPQTSVDSIEMAKAAASGGDRSGFVRAATEFWVQDGVIYAAPVRAPQG